MKNYEIGICKLNMTCKIEKYLGSDTEVCIPSEIDGYKVTHIGSCAFYECNSLTSVTIPDGVLSIGSSAFCDCSNLVNVTIGDSVTSIGNSAFDGCGSLTGVIIPGSVTSIGHYTFARCHNLTSITIPKNVASIGWGAFAGCFSLMSIKVDKNNLVYHSAGNCLIETESKRLALGCKDSTIPSDGSVASIGEGAFYICSELTNIIIPNNVTNIGDGAFSGCRNLTNATVSGAITSIGESAFDGCSSLAEINFTGTKAQWKGIEKGDDWDEDTGKYIVRCTDGNIE